MSVFVRSFQTVPPIPKGPEQMISRRVLAPHPPQGGSVPILYFGVLSKILLGESVSGLKP